MNCEDRIVFYRVNPAWRSYTLDLLNLNLLNTCLLRPIDVPPISSLFRTVELCVVKWPKTIIFLFALFLNCFRCFGSFFSKKHLLLSVIFLQPFFSPSNTKDFSRVFLLFERINWLYILRIRSRICGRLSEVPIGRYTECQQKYSVNKSSTIELSTWPITARQMHAWMTIGLPR